MADFDKLQAARSKIQSYIDQAYIPVRIKVDLRERLREATSMMMLVKVYAEAQYAEHMTELMGL